MWTQAAYRYTERTAEIESHTDDQILCGQGFQCFVNTSRHTIVLRNEIEIRRYVWRVWSNGRGVTFDSLLAEVASENIIGVFNQNKPGILLSKHMCFFLQNGTLGKALFYESRTSFQLLKLRLQLVTAHTENQPNGANI